jgi:hypothetical protein
MLLIEILIAKHVKPPCRNTTREEETPDSEAPRLRPHRVVRGGDHPHLLISPLLLRCCCAADAAAAARYCCCCCLLSKLVSVTRNPWDRIGDCRMGLPKKRQRGTRVEQENTVSMRRKQKPLKDAEGPESTLKPFSRQLTHLGSEPRGQIPCW